MLSIIIVYADITFRTNFFHRRALSTLICAVAIEYDGVVWTIIEMVLESQAKWANTINENV